MAQALSGAAGAGAAAAAKHVMVSYQWDAQDIVVRLVASLKQRGFAVWLDLDEMSGSTLDAMAAAVEGAACVLLCMSEKYKASANCRLEGNCESRRSCGNTKGYSSTYLSMGLADVRAGTRYPSGH